MKSVWKKWLKTEAAGWRLAVSQDPLLPDSLLPAGYRGKTAWTRRLEALRSLPEAG
ncbi:MAG: PaaX family transcriptional regulator C-terminal domain-containing protein [Opitutaceae bacterium]